MEFSILAAMGFKESSIQQAMAEAARRPDRITHLHGIIEILINTTAPHNVDSFVNSAAMSATERSSESSVSRTPRQPAAAVGGGAIMSISRRQTFSRVVPAAASEQVEIIADTLFKQRHIFGFAIQAKEQVEASR